MSQLSGKGSSQIFVEKQAVLSVMDSEAPTFVRIQLEKKVAPCNLTIRRLSHFDDDFLIYYSFAHPNPNERFHFMKISNPTSFQVFEDKFKHEVTFYEKYLYLSLVSKTGIKVHLNVSFPCQPRERR